MNTLTLSIAGMHCAGCVRRVSSLLSSVPGVSVKDVRVGAATLDLDPTRTSPGAIVGALRSGGYDAHEEPDHDRR